jgi:hypothetical protein
MFLSRFYAVTEYSIYCLRAELDQDGYVFIEKFAQRGSGSLGLGQRLQGGTVALIAGGRLHSVDPGIDPRECPFYLNLAVRTSRLVGLFFTMNEAIEAFNASDPQPWDDRWFRQSGEVLKRIGNDHPFFRVYSADAAVK